MNIKKFYELLEALYPRSLSCEWDNDGIMCCRDVDADMSKVMISLDATANAIRYAADRGCDLLLTHHPMLFRPPHSVTNNEHLGNRIICALDRKVSVISLHTRLDAGDGGVNDKLLETLGLGNGGKFGSDESPALGRYVDLDEPLDSRELASLCKEKLGCACVRTTGSGKVKRIAVVGGSGGDFVKPALALGADVLITGECSYNAAQDAFEDGLIVIEAGHYETEVPVCNRLGEICSMYGISYELFDSRIFSVV